MSRLETPIGGRTPSDRRTCWDCGQQLVLPGVDDIRLVDQAARRLGWTYVELNGSWRAGRMRCQDCTDLLEAEKRPPVR